MGSKGGSAVPPPPDPRVVAAAQSGMNLEAAELTGELNRIGAVSPFGTTTYEAVPQTPQTADEQRDIRDYWRTKNYIDQSERVLAESPGQYQDTAWMADLENVKREFAALPEAVRTGGGRIARPSRYIQRTTFSPQVQALIDAQMQNQIGLAGLAGSQQEQIRRQAPLNFEGLPGMVSRLDLEGLPQMVRGLDLSNLPGLPGSGGYEQSRRRVEEALMSRLEPNFQGQRRALEARMAEQGIAPGNEAYRGAVDEMNRALTDARMQAVLSGGQEQSRLAGLDMAARGQGISEQLNIAELIARARGQEISEQQAQAQLAQTARQQGISERATLSSLPYERLAQIMGLGQGPNLPQQPGMPQVNVAPADYQGAAGQAYQSQLQNVLGQNQARAQTQGDISSLLGTLAMAAAISDERLKTNVLPYRGGLSEIMELDPVKFQYRDGSGLDSGTQHGLIAQDVALQRPDAVVDIDGQGTLGVQYMKMIPELISAIQEQQEQIRRIRGRD